MFKSLNKCKKSLNVHSKNIAGPNILINLHVLADFYCDYLHFGQFPRKWLSSCFLFAWLARRPLRPSSETWSCPALRSSGLPPHHQQRLQSTLLLHQHLHFPPMHQCRHQEIQYFELRFIQINVYVCKIIVCVFFLQLIFLLRSVLTKDPWMYISKK